MGALPRKIAVASALAALMVAGGAGGPIGVTRSRTRAREVCALPAYDYQHLKYAQPIVAVSQTAVLVPVPGTAACDAAGRRVKYFQLATAAMRVDHCSISRFVMVLRDDGAWSISLRADQNEHPPDSIPAAPAIAPDAPLPATTKQTLQIRRNQFVVLVRGYADYPLKVDDPDVLPGRPLLFDALPEPFWVQNGQPLEVRSSGRSTALGDEFGLIDRVEVEFRYR